MQIDFHEPFGIQEFPEGTTDEQIWAKYDELKRSSAPPPPVRQSDTPSPSVGDYAKSITGNIIRGAAGMTAQTARGVADFNRNFFPFSPEVSNRALDYAGGAVERAGEAIAPAEVPSLKGTWWGDKIPSGLGSTIPLIAGGLATRLTKLPGWLAASLSGFGAGAEQMYEDALAHGESKDQAKWSLLYGGITGASEGLGAGRILDRMDKATGGSLWKTVFRVGGDTVEELLQNAGQQLAQDYGAKTIFGYDKDRELLPNFLEAAGQGGAVGLIASTLLNALNVPIRRAQERSNLRRGETRRRAVISEAVQSGELIPETKGTYAPQSPSPEGARNLPAIPEAQGLAEASAPVRGLGTQPVEAAAEEAAVAPPTTNLVDSSSQLVIPAAEQGVNQPAPAAPPVSGKILPQNAQVAESVPAPPETASSIPAAEAKLQGEVIKAAATEGQRSAIDIKEELIAEIQARLIKAPSDLENVPPEQQKVTIEIPGDGTFTVFNTVEALSELLARAKKIKTDTGKVSGVPRGALKVRPELRPFQYESRVASLPANPIGEQAVRARLTELGAQPDSMISVVNDQTDLVDARIGFSDKGEPQSITINAAAIGSPEQVDRAIEHEAAHVVVEGGAIGQLLSQLTGEERAAINAAMAHLGYATGSQEEFDARGVDALSQAFRGRNWFERLVAWIQSVLAKLRFPMSRLAAERAASRAVGRAVKESFATAAGTAPVTQTFESRTPTTFETRSQVDLTVSDPLLKPAQIQVARDLAAVQSSLVNQETVDWIDAAPVSKADARAKPWLRYLKDRFEMSDMQALLRSMPETTDEQKQAKEVAGGAILNHYGTDRAVEAERLRDLEAKFVRRAEVGKRVAKMNDAQLKANFLEALFNRFTSDYRQYIVDQIAAAPASANIDSKFRQNLGVAERRLNDQQHSPGALQAALSAIATNIPTNLFTTGTTNQQIVDWALQSGVLSNVVGQDVRQWLTVDAGNGVPALIGYARLLPDLVNLRELLLKREQVKKDLTDFEQWFSPTGKATKATPKQLAERYFKARTGRDKALAIAQAIEKEIDDLDTDIFANQIALERLRALMTSPTYVSTVREAADKAHVVVRALYDTNGFRTGLIHRGGEAQGLSAGLLRMTGPMTQREYLVELHPSSSQEFENNVRLKAFAAEAVQYAVANESTDPLLADSYLSLAAEIDKYYVHPALNPATGFTQRPWLQIPGTTIRFGMDPSGILPKTLRSVLEKIGGRTAVQAVRDMNELDSVMKQVDGINNHKEYGYARQTEAILKAIESHSGWSPDQFARWDEMIAEKVFAAGQSALSPAYEVGDVIAGSGGLKLTAADMAALRLAKRWEDAVLRSAPRLILDRIADLGIIRKAVGSGRFTMARVQAQWVSGFMTSWDEIPADEANDAQRWALFDHENIFRRVILGYVTEFNPEFARMNAASPKVTPFFKTFRKMAQQEKAGVRFFNNTNEVLDFMANEMVAADPALDYPTALANAREALMDDIRSFVKAFKDGVIGRKQDSVWGAVPDAVVQVATANNAFTLPRGELLAPSSFYSYSTGSDGRRFVHVGSLRSLMNLQVIQSMREAFAAMTTAKNKLHDRIDELETAGRKRGDAMNEMIRETQRSRKLNEARYDYYELLDALKMTEAVFSEMERFEASTAEHYQSPAIAVWMNVFGTLKASLLSNTQAITTNTFSGAMLGPALIHLQTGRLGKAMVDFVWEPHMWGTMYRRLSDAVASNPIMSKLLRQHAPVWSWMARQITDASADWRKVEEIAVSSGMVAPYNYLSVIANKKALKSTGGRLETDTTLKELPRGVSMVNTVMSAPGPAWLIEGARAFSPRIFDNFINYANIVAFEYETDFLRKIGWAAFKAREEQATRTGNNWKDLSDPANVLQPADLRLRTHKALNRYRQLFSGLGSLDKVLLDFYERTKGMTQEQRAEAPLIPDPGDYSSIALQYATTNISTESNRPPLFKGKGTDGTWRNVAGTFMGWPINMARMMSTMLETHSKDPQFFRIAHGMIGLALLVLLFSVGGAWNWELGDELTKLTSNVSSARIQLGNVAKGAQEGELWTAALYMIQGFVNSAAFIGPAFGSLAGVAFTGRGNPFDVTSWNPFFGWVWDTWNTGKRIVQTGDATLPLLDYTRRWAPLSKIVINRLPLMQGLVDQQNAVRSMLGSAPRGTEIKWGQGGGGTAARYGRQNDEIMKLVASAYEAVAHGGSEEEVHKRRQVAIDAYVKAGKTEEEAIKSVNAALASKEPIRVLTGKEFASTEEEAKWVARMTPSQKADYDRAVQAWNLLGSVTGRNMSFVAGEGGGGGGGSRSIPGLASSLPTGISIPSGLPSGRAGLRLPSLGASPSLASYTPRGLGGVRSIRRTRRTGSRRGLSGLRRRTTKIKQPRLASSRRRSTRRRVRSYA